MLLARITTRRVSKKLTAIPSLTRRVVMPHLVIERIAAKVLTIITTSEMRCLRTMMQSSPLR